MSFRIACVAAVAACMAASGASAQVQQNGWPTTARATRAMIENMPADAWIRLMQESVNLGFFVGKPIVAVINATEEPLTSVTCDGKWVLLGPNPYIKGAPATVRAHSIGFIPTDGFDDYCTKSIVGITEGGERHNGALTIPGNFSQSVSIIFQAGQ